MLATRYPMKPSLAFLILAMLVGGGFAATRFARDVKEQSSCDVLQHFLEDRNLTGVVTIKDSVQDSHSTICGGKCCDKEMEEQLRQQAKDDFHSQIHHHSRSLLGLLATTADALRETVMMLARQSENKTLTLFNQVYRAMAAQSKSSIDSLYQTMIDYVSVSNTDESLQQPLTQDMLHERFDEFFTRLFPIAYHQVVNPVQGQQDFTEKFKNCLYKNMDELEPFGDIPKQIGHSLGKSLEATRVLIQALTLGKSVLEKTDGLIFSGTSTHKEGCYKALLRMTHCPKCRGISREIMPCRGFCTNVMRGCLTEPASELDFAWSEYVETVERLVVAFDHQYNPLALNVEHAVRHLDSRISDAVMHAMEKGPALEEKVRKVCGRPELESASGSQLVLPASLAASTRPSGAGGPQLGLDGRPILSVPPSLQHLTSSSSSSSSLTSMLLDRAQASIPARAASQLHAQFGNFMASVERSKSFYGTLADTICEEYPDKTCWNGEKVGQYEKTVVATNLQKYNPELSFSSSNVAKNGYANANTSVLIDQLRHINQVVQSQLMSAPDTGALLADETFEGSGSGDRPIWGRRPGEGNENDDDDDEDAGDDRDDTESSGSGMGPIEIDRTPDGNNGIESKDAAGQLSLSLTTLLTMLLVSLLLSNRHELGTV